MIYFIKNILRYPINLAIKIIKYTRSVKWDVICERGQYVNILLDKKIKAILLAKGDIARLLYINKPFVKIGAGFENDEVKYFTSNLHYGDFVVDAGANIGFYSILASKLVGESGRIFSFEPSTTTIEIFEKNISINKLNNIRIIPKGLGNINGTFNLVTPSDIPTGYSDSYRFIQTTNCEKDKIKDYEVVNLVTLDDFLLENKIKKIDFFKIDVEGFQLQVLEGAKRTLLENNVKILFEAPPDNVVKNINNYSQEKTFRFLQSIGYGVFTLKDGQLHNIEEKKELLDGSYVSIKNKFCN